MTEHDLALIGRQVGSKAAAADRELNLRKSCNACKNGITLPTGVVCKITGLPISKPEGGCHKFKERVNYE